MLHYIILSCVLAACSGSREHQDKPVLTVSIEPQRKMLEELADGRFSVVTLLGAGTDPESFEPTMSQRVAISESAALFTVGHLPFEPVLARSVGEGAMIVDTSEGIEPVNGTHSHGHGEAHDDADPHVWTSLRNGKVMAANMLRALVALDPEHSDQYNARYEKMAQRLDSLDEAMAASLRSGGAHAFAIWHPSLSYFARDYDLHQIAVGQDSRELSPATMKEIITEAREDSVKVFFAQKAYDSRQAAGISEAIGSEMVTIDPMAYDWENEIIKAVHALTR